LAHSPQGQNYLTAVFSSFGTRFEACFAYDNAGNLTVGHYGTIIYGHDELNNASPLWQATPVAGKIPEGFILSFHGSVGGDAGQTIHANALNDLGDTFIVDGVAIGTCPQGRWQRQNPGIANAERAKFFTRGRILSGTGLLERC
jgi:hypothetical protein